MTGVSMSLFLASQVIEPVFPLYVVGRGASTFDLGLIVSLVSFTAIAAKIPLGILAQRLGKWPVIPAALLVQSLSLLLYSLVGSPLWFYPVRVLHALAIASFSPTAIALASDLAPPGRRGDRIGRFLTSYGAATMIGPFLCTLLLGHLNYPQLFQLAAVIPLPGFAAFLLARRRTSLFVFTEQKPKERRASNPLGLLRGVALSRNVLVLSYVRLIFSFTRNFFFTLFVVYASSNLLLTSSLIAFLFGVKGVTNMMFRFPSGKLADKIGHRAPLILAYLLLTLAYLTLSETGDFLLLALAMALHGLAHAMRAVTEWSLLGDSVTPETSGVATAYVSTMFNIGGALGAVAAGALSLILPLPSIFQLSSLIILTGAPAALLIETETRQN